MVLVILRCFADERVSVVAKKINIKPTRGFTLIELLVVIAVIALLMSIMMPALGQAKKYTRAVICRANLRQWGLCWKMFVDDNNDQFMGSLMWFRPLERYYKDRKLLLCPSAKKPPQTSNNPAQYTFIYGYPGGKFNTWSVEYPWSSGDFWYGSYGLNEWVTYTDNYIGGRPPEYLWKTANVKGAAEIPLFTDCSAYGYSPWHQDEPPAYDGQTYIRDPINVNEIRAGCLNRHPGATINGLFLDFGTRKIGLKELWELKWHRKWFVNQDGRADHNPPIWPAWMKNFKDYAAN